jgi:hypothetical protein
MLHRYNSFKEDLILESAINESMIFYTRDFKDSLIKLRNLKKSVIAQNLLEVEYTDVKPDMTFISLGDNEGDIKFTQFKKAVSLIKKGLEAKYTPDIAKNLFNDIEEKMKGGTITDGEIRNLFTYQDYELSTKSRNSTGIGRLVNQIFPGKYSSKEVEEFVNNFKNLNKPGENKFILVKGEDIRKYYLVSNYEEEAGDLGNSCMRYDKCQKYLDIYVENTEIVQLLVYLNEEDKVLGRALVWKLNDHKSSDIEEAEFFMDRIYGKDDSITKLFKDYSDEMGWARRTYSGYSQVRDITYKGENHNWIDIRIRLDKAKFNYYPYMDTFKRLDVDNRLLYNDDNEDQDWGLTCTDGTYEDYSGVWSDYYDERIPEDEAVYSDWLESYIRRNDAVEVSVGNRRYLGWYPEDSNDIVYDEFREEYINEHDAYYSEFLDRSYYEGDNTSIITSVDDDIYSWSISISRFDYGDVSDESDVYSDAISTSRLACENYLDHDGVHYNFYDGMLSYSEEMGKYYITDLRIEVYDTDLGMLSRSHCELLDIKPGKGYYTDELHYLFRNPNLEKLIDAIDKKLDYYNGVLDGRLPRIKFEDEDEYLNKVKNLLRSLNLEKEVLENWIE